MGSKERGVRNIHNSANPNATWLLFKGFPVWYTGVFWVIHLTILAIPILTTAWVWTLTNLVHALVTFYLFHWSKGAPVPTIDDAASQTQWEQIDEDSENFHWTRKFLFLFPALPFLLAVEYSEHNHVHFLINVAALLLCVVPKLPGLEGVRLFGINKY